MRNRALPFCTLLALAACARNPSPQLLAPAAAVPASDSAAFDQFVADYAEGRRGGAARGDSLAWLHGYEVACEEEAAGRAAGQLTRLRAIDTTRLGVPQRIDWLVVESWLKRAVYDTVLHTAQRVPGRYLTLGNLT